MQNKCKVNRSSLFSHSSFFAGAAVPRRPPNAPRFRGVTKHKRTQRYEAHIWECKKQIYLGGFDSEILAAKSHGKKVKMDSAVFLQNLPYSRLD